MLGKVFPDGVRSGAETVSNPTTQLHCRPFSVRIEQRHSIFARAISESMDPDWGSQRIPIGFRRPGGEGCEVNRL